MRLRVGHNIVLFAILPRIVSVLLGRRPSVPDVIKDVFDGAAVFERADISDCPGFLITKLLTMVDRPNDGLQALITDLHPEKVVFNRT